MKTVVWPFPQRRRNSQRERRRREGARNGEGGVWGRWGSLGSDVTCHGGLGLKRRRTVEEGSRGDKAVGGFRGASPLFLGNTAFMSASNITHPQFKPPSKGTERIESLCWRRKKSGTHSEGSNVKNTLSLRTI